MKKNEAMGWLVYLLMIGIAAAVGFGVLRGELSNNVYTDALGMNPIIFVFIMIVGGILLTAILLELGHIIGARVGKYRISKVNIVGIQWKKGKDGKFKFSFSFNFDGITGETVVAPQDVEKSNPRHIIYFPLLFLFLEVALCVAAMVVGKTLASRTAVWEWLYVAGLVVLVIALMIHLYNIFPAALDSKNDGYLITILNSKTNVQAYNNLLTAQEQMDLGLPAQAIPVYEKVTDFTNSINQVSLYKALSEEKYDEAFRINELTIACKDKVSSRVYDNAVAQKIAIELLSKDLDAVKDDYINLPLLNKKFIASLSSAPAVRAYILVSGLIEESENEVKAALSRLDKVLKGSGEKKETEEKLIKRSLKKVVAKHPDWDFSDYNILLDEESKGS